MGGLFRFLFLQLLKVKKSKSYFWDIISAMVLNVQATCDADCRSELLSILCPVGLPIVRLYMLPLCTM
jgi:hypothetical protein